MARTSASLLGMLFDRDLVIVLVGVVLYRTQGLVVVANRWGKYTTACMGFMALSHRLQPPAVLRDGLIGLAAVMLLISSASYALLVRGLAAPTEQQQSP